VFNDFENHCIGGPQIAPVFGVGTGNLAFAGPGGDEDFGLEDITLDPGDRYKFRTSPLRNVALQPAFFHNGCFTRLEDAIAHHLDVVRSALSYDPAKAGVDPDLHHVGPVVPVLERVDERLVGGIPLTRREFADLVDFVRFGLLDRRALPGNLRRLIPEEVSSGRMTLEFE
jgi:cytochrome c peroxidase